MKIPKEVFSKCNKQYPREERGDATVQQKFLACNMGYGIVPPIGWYGYKTSEKDDKHIPVVQRLPYWELSSYLENEDQVAGAFEMAASALPTGDNKYYTLFNQRCPMYVSTDTKPSEATCCMHKFFIEHEDEGTVTEWATKKSQYNSGNDLSKHLNIETIQNNAYYRIFPKCAELLKYLPCAACHANLSNMAYEQVPDVQSPYDYEMSQGNANFYSYPLCTSYALEVYKQCRHVYYVTKYTQSNTVDPYAYLPPGTQNTRLIVPDGFGEHDFLELVHSPGYNALEDSINESLDKPMENCIDPRIWNEKYK